MCPPNGSRTDGVLVAPLLDTYRLHAAEVGRVTVRAGQHEEPAELRVVVEQVEDVDGTADSTEPRVLLHEPDGWTEDYTLSEAAWLAALLQRPASWCTAGARRRTTGERVLRSAAGRSKGWRGGRLTRAEISRTPDRAPAPARPRH